MQKEDQINCLPRVNDFFKLNTFRTVEHYDVSSHFQSALSALKEENKFLKYLGSTDWPLGMDKIRRNILQTTVLDEEIT